MLLDALLAWLHFLCIFALVGTIGAELVLYRREMTVARVAQLASIDSLVGVSAGLVIVSGVLRVTLGLKGASFYMHSPVFWTKMALFLAVFALSIGPTMHFVRLKRGAGGGSVTVPEGLYRNVWAVLITETVLFACIPLLATLLTHGYQAF